MTTEQTVETPNIPSRREYHAAPWRLPEILRILGVMAPLAWVLYGVPAIRATEAANMASMMVGLFVSGALAGLVAFAVARVIELLERIEVNTRSAPVEMETGRAEGAVPESIADRSEG